MSTNDHSRPSYEELAAENTLLRAENENLRNRIAYLEGVVLELNEQVKSLLLQTSRNSSKAPSGDRKRLKPTRKKSNKAVGGQKGHKGETLELVNEPDAVLVHKAEYCVCGASLKDVKVLGVEQRQVFEIPSMPLEVTEHQAEVKQCPCCGQKTKGVFPEGVSQRVQYGARLKAVSVYLHQYQLIPYGRVQECVADLFGQRLSQGSLVSFDEQCYQQLAETENAIKAAIKASPVIHVDETGCYEKTGRHWLHSASTSKLTFYANDQGRGREAMNRIGVLPGFKGTAVHDAYAPYWGYNCKHALCNAHLLRELAYLAEQEQQDWGDRLANLLLDVKHALGFARLTKAQQLAVHSAYQALIDEGWRENPIVQSIAKVKKRGRKKHTKAQNLLLRLSKYSTEVLRFMSDWGVPFDNNQGERDLRMMKVQQKISGRFRGRGGAYFCRIRGYISSLRKQSMDVLDALVSVFRGQPILPSLRAE
jgi:transposase